MVKSDTDQSRVSLATTNIGPFVKIDQALDRERDGCQLTNPLPERDALLSRAGKLDIFGTKMRSVIAQPSKAGIAAIMV